MSLTLLSQNTEYPVDVNTLKQYLGLNTTGDFDSIVQDCLEGAVEFTEKVTSRSLRQRTYTQTFNNFCNSLELDISPVVSVTSVKYYDTANTLQTISPADYTLYKPAKLAAYVVPNVGYWSFSVFSARPDGGVVVEYVTGATSDWMLWSTAKDAIRTLAIHRFYNRNIEHIQDDIPPGYWCIANQLRLI